MATSTKYLTREIAELTHHYWIRTSMECFLNLTQLSLSIFYLPGATLPGQYPGSPTSPRSPRSPYSSISPSRTLPRNFKSYHEASGVHTLLEQPSRYSISGSQTLPKNYKAISPATSPVGSPTKTLEPAIDLPVSLIPGIMLWFWDRVASNVQELVSPLLLRLFYLLTR